MKLRAFIGDVQSCERGKLEASGGLDRDRVSSHDAEAMAETSVFL